jgi:hypothetical protein
MFVPVTALPYRTYAGIRTVISFNGQTQEAARYERALANGKKDGIMKSLYTGVAMSITDSVMFCAYALAFW